MRGHVALSARVMSLVMLAGIACDSKPKVRVSTGVGCVLSPGTSDVKCPVSARYQSLSRPSLTPARDVMISSMHARRLKDRLVVDARFEGGFRNELDQNAYLFIGEAATPSTYALTADARFAEDVGYAVRLNAPLSHRLDIRAGLMAPTVSSYTPQVYLADPRHAAVVGPDTGIAQQVDGRDLHVEIPLDRLYERRATAVPTAIGVTLATARDYVGFIDQRSIASLLAGGEGDAAASSSPPALYPTLDLDSHVFTSVRIARNHAEVSIDLEVKAPIEDWAQTNLQFFFVPLPTRKADVTDPSRAVQLRYAWSYYCAVYSPHQIFCKRSVGSDFSYDTSYSERTSLAPPPGVRFESRSGRRYVLTVPAENIGDGPDGFATTLLAGRDGFGPTAVYGLETSP